MDEPNWQERLHPDGAPGESEIALRKMLGDGTYEQLRDNTKRIQELHFASSEAHTAHVRAKSTLLNMLAFAVFLGAVVGTAVAVWWMA